MFNKNLKEIKNKKEQIFRGYWWEYKRKKQKVFGILKIIQNEKIILELDGIIPSLTENKDKFNDFDIILGEALNENNHKINITLHKGHEFKKSFSDPGNIKLSFIEFYYAFIGHHINTANNLKFKEISVNYLFLEEWSDISFIKSEIIHEKAHNDFIGEELIKYKIPKSIELLNNNKIKILIDFSYRLSKDYISCYLEKINYIRFESKKLKKFEDYFEVINKIRNFLSIAVTEAIYPLDIESKIVLKNNENNFNIIKIYQSHNFHSTLSKLDRFEMLFTLEEVKKEISFYIKNWIGNVLIDYISSLYFGWLSNPNLFIESKFLSLVGILESYHKNIINNRDLELRKRITELFIINHDVFDNFMTTVNRDNFIDATVKTRNHFTHNIGAPEIMPITYDKLIEITKKLEILLVVIFLKIIGFNSTEISDRVSKRSRHRYEFQRGWNF